MKKIIMKRISILLYSVLLLVVTSCSPSEEEINALGNKAKKRIEDSYSWEFITKQYENQFLGK